MGAFGKPVPIGPVTLIQRLSGQQYTANGVLDLSTGQFVRTGVNWTQVGWYGVDTAIDSILATWGSTKIYSHHLESQMEELNR